MSKTSLPRGRPRLKITRDQIADAGIKMGLLDLTIVGVAANLGVSHMTLYVHVADLESLKKLVAETIFLRWPLGGPTGTRPEDLRAYMEALSISMWRLVRQNPGLAPYLLRDDMITAAMIEKITTHQIKFSQAFDLSIAQSRWLFMTICHVCVSVADTLQPAQKPSHDGDDIIDPRYQLGVRALIIGALEMLDEIEELARSQQ